jgi:hypothetical protein
MSCSSKDWRYVTTGITENRHFDLGRGQDRLHGHRFNRFESSRQFYDALRVYELQFVSLDQAYMESWARNLNISTLLDRLKKLAEPLS